MGRNKKYIKNRSESLSSSWQSVLFACSIFGAGFYAGSYLSNIDAKIQKLEIAGKHQEEKILLREAYLKEIDLLRNKNLELQKTILDNGRKK